MSTVLSRRSLKAAVVVASAIIVSGCTYSIDTTENTFKRPENPDLNCVAHTLRSDIEGVNQVDYARVEAKTISRGSWGRSDSVHRFAYQGNGFWGLILIHADSGFQSKTYRHELSSHPRPPARCAVDYALPIMREVEKALGQNCDFSLADNGLDVSIAATHRKKEKMELPSPCGPIQVFHEGFHMQKRSENTHALSYVGESGVSLENALKPYNEKAFKVCGENRADIQIIAAGLVTRQNSIPESAFCNYEPYIFGVDSATGLAAWVIVNQLANVACIISNSSAPKADLLPVIEGTVTCNKSKDI